MLDFLKQLNTTQKDAVVNQSGPSLIIAGAGSGKTRVLTYKIAHLLHSGVNPNKVLALTFTNKAAKEMKERIAEIIGVHKATKLWMGTFHSIFSKILRIEAEYLGFTNNFTIYDTEDSKSIITSIVKGMQLDSQIYKTNDILGQISMAKNNLITPSSYMANGEFIEKDRQKKRPLFSEIFLKYSNKCKSSNGMDFDDLLLYTNILIRDFPEILKKYQDRFDYILVDEYQDTNFSQYLIIKKLSAAKQNISVVGDDSQSIYSFRGAKIENILNFKSDFPSYKLFKLEQNYRSTKNIVNAANSLIEKNKGRIPKNIWSENSTGDKIKVIKCYTDAEESYSIAEEITRAIYDKKLKYSDFAILYRTNAQSRIFEEVLLKKNIPYRIYGSISFYQRKEIKDILAYLRVIVNTKDDESLKRIINFPHRGIGDASLSKITQLASQQQTSLFNIIENINQYGLNIRSKSLQAIIDFTETIRYFKNLIDNKNAYEITEELLKKTGIHREIFNNLAPEGVERAGNVEQLMASIQYFCNEEAEDHPSIDKFLESVSLLTDADTNSKDKFDKVTLMTVHSSKGLEFDHVFIAGAEEDLFPFFFSKDSLTGIEEERRLFYVAITRACNKAFISYTEQRFKYGNYINCKPSRFIKEIDDLFLDNPNIELLHEADDFEKNAFTSEFKRFNNPAIKQKPYTVNKPYMPITKNLKKINEHSQKCQDEISEINYEVGMKVEHAKFGHGTILQIEGTFPNTKLIVDFAIDGQKNLLVKFAKLNIL